MMNKRGKREKFDDSRWGDYYCAAGRAEEGTGGQRGERKRGQHLSEKKTSPLSPIGDFPGEEDGGSGGGEDLLVAENVFLCLDAGSLSFLSFTQSNSAQMKRDNTNMSCRSSYRPSRSFNAEILLFSCPFNFLFVVCFEDEQIT